MQCGCQSPEVADSVGTEVATDRVYTDTLNGAMTTEPAEVKELKANLSQKDGELAELRKLVRTLEEMDKGRVLRGESNATNGQTDNPRPSVAGNGIQTMHKCPQGHNLSSVPVGTHSTGHASHTCDECKKTMGTHEQILRCHECNFDLCDDCTTKIELIGAQDSQPEASSKLDKKAFDDLAKSCFIDEKWVKGCRHLSRTKYLNKKDVLALLREGAKSFGFWHLSDFALGPLIEHFLGDSSEAKKPSPALVKWLELIHKDDVEEPKAKKEEGFLVQVGNAIQQTANDAQQALQQTANDAQSALQQTGDQIGSTLKTAVSSVAGRVKVDNTDKSMRLTQKQVDETLKQMFGDHHHGFQRFLDHVPGWKAAFVRMDILMAMQYGPAVFIFVVSTAYAMDVCLRKYPDAPVLFSWPIYIARAGGMAAALWTALLYFTMARGTLVTCARCIPRCCSEYILIFLDAHKDIHITAGKFIFMTGIIHTAAHCLGTVPGILTHTADELNAVVGCALGDDAPYYFHVDLEFARWPPCPFVDVPRTFDAALFGTMPGFTGVLLVIMICAIAYTGSAQNRKKNFDLFWYVHNVAIIFWPILLFFHGSQGWVGIGFPLVVIVSGWAILLYIKDRILRTFRYFAFAGKSVHIVSATIRPGHSGGPAGALANIKIAKPPFLWNYHSGMYAFICMPEYAPLQWHPFTICSGLQSDTVDFIISGIGDWTRELAHRCLDAQNEGKTLPVVALDGPYMAPTQTALFKQIIVAVGAGVGITPFISIMSTIASLLGDDDDANDPPLVEAHFYWMTRSTDEFLLARHMFAKIVRTAALKERMFFHLYTTAREGPKDAAAYMFREAIKRQSAVDRKAFQEGIKGVTDMNRLLTGGPQLPHTWLNGGEHDVFWTREIIREDTDQEKAADHDHDEHGHTEYDHPKFHQVRHPKMKEQPQPAKTPELLSSHVDVEGKTKVKTGDWMVPIVFGRPDFANDIRSIGRARPGMDVHAYVCGNDAIVHNLQDVAHVCNHLAKKDHLENGAPPQTYAVHFERFG